jgi:hypothetical protein
VKTSSEVIRADVEMAANWDALERSTSRPLRRRI